MQIKDQIRARREALGVEMSELGSRVGVTEQAVRHWESGRSYPGKQKIKLIERALSFKLDWSEGVDPVSDANTAAAMIDPEDVKLLLVLSQLPLRAKTTIGDIARMHLDAVNQARRGAPPPPPDDPMDAVRDAVARSVASGRSLTAAELSPAITSTTKRAPVKPR